MMNNQPVLEHPAWLVGVGGSPYTRKLRSALRFRRIPYHFVVSGSKEASLLPDRPLPLLPYLVLPGQDGEPSTVLSDTTPIIDHLEERVRPRRLRPADPALRLFDLLFEDYGDEWLSKCMFHYRWANAPDTRKASSYIPYGVNIQLTPQEGQQFEALFAQRQISRIGVVGSNATTAPIIEASWHRWLQLFDRHIQNTPYVLGARPGAGDFACYGQMTQLVITDPTPGRVALKESPRAYAWTERLEDVSGLEVSDTDWLDIANPPDTLKDLLRELGRAYAPFMLGNAAAVAQGADKVECEVDGKPWVQEPFVYPAKCLRWLREAYRALPVEAKNKVDNLLSGTGCERLFDE
ncbi:MAG: glutathione S-transferase N-terminal domain-containing protein [Gammaproteobacteria bacterium]|nr:glutathione S-transferase N-terminal domain-containing protein [Gammaproteobacteria bacterium]